MLRRFVDVVGGVAGDGSFIASINSWSLYSTQKKWGAEAKNGPGWFSGFQAEITNPTFWDPFPKNWGWLRGVTLKTGQLLQ